NRNVVVNLIGLPLDQRPQFFASLLPRLSDLRARTGRPHRIVVDETHHLLPETWAPSAVGGAPEFQGFIFVTVHPQHVARAALEAVDCMLVIGRDPAATLAAFTEALHKPAPPGNYGPLESGEALLYWIQNGGTAQRIRTLPPRVER